MTPAGLGGLIAVAWLIGYAIADIRAWRDERKTKP